MRPGDSTDREPISGSSWVERHYLAVVPHATFTRTNDTAKREEMHV